MARTYRKGSIIQLPCWFYPPVMHIRNLKASGIFSVLYIFPDIFGVCETFFHIFCILPHFSKTQSRDILFFLLN